MKIAFLTPGAGKMYCGGCLHDNTLVAALNKLGHKAILVPLYLPLQLEDQSQSDKYPIFYNGINVFLDQNLGVFRYAPGLIRKITSFKPLIKLAARFSSTTDPRDVGEIAVSMLQGEEGKQRRELEELVDWLEANFKPDVVCLSNSLLLGMARRISERLNCAVVCQFQGEDAYINSMSAVYRARVWRLLDEKIKDALLFIAPSQYCTNAMRQRLIIPDEKIRIVYNGINVSEFQTTSGVQNQRAKTIGYFARMCDDKGLHLLVESFIELKNRKGYDSLKLKIGGVCLPKDENYVKTLKQKLKYAGLLEETEFYPNVNKKEKIAFYQSIDILCVPSVLSEAFGLYTIEAMAAGAPLVLPRHGSFPEIVEETNTGILYAPNFTEYLISALDKMINDTNLYNNCKKNCLTAAREKFDATVMAQNFINALQTVVKG
ncbi:MAG: glycosyltransferase family 4 protein [Verrucomicrobiia bacterium]